MRRGKIVELKKICCTLIVSLLWKRIYDFMKPFTHKRGDNLSVEAILWFNQKLLNFERPSALSFSDSHFRVWVSYSIVAKLMQHEYLSKQFEAKHSLN
jgi:hypothetical protein